MLQYSSVVRFEKALKDLNEWVEAQDNYAVSSSDGSQDVVNSAGQTQKTVTDTVVMDVPRIDLDVYKYELAYIGGFSLFEAFQQEFLKEIAWADSKNLPDNFQINLKEYLQAKKGHSRNEFRINCLVEYYTRPGVSATKWFKVIRNTYNISIFSNEWQKKINALKGARNAYTHRSGILKIKDLEKLQNKFTDLPSFKDRQIKPHSEYFYKEMILLFGKIVTKLSS